MKVGDYVRTIYGIKKIYQIVCGQDVRFDNTDGFDELLLYHHNYDGISINSETWKQIVMGEPKKRPIDLIEVGDYVNGECVSLITKNNYIEIGYGEEYDGLHNEDIKSIVTKEQFERMEYRIGE